MVIAENLDEIPAAEGKAVIAMGDFDGLHHGHRALIDETIRRARAAGLRAILLTYEPSPKKILKRLSVDQRLTTHDEKKKLLAATGLDLVVFYPVSAATLRISAQNFLRRFLIERLHLRTLVMGADHHFGHNRRGNAAYLRAAAGRYGFEPVIIGDQLSGAERASSSRIRKALAEGDSESAARILGRPYSVSGTVVRGAAQGTQIGFPTANLAFDAEKLLPAPGVYAGTAVLPDGQRIAAVANLGRKPTAGTHPLGLEVHLLDFSADLYNKPLAFEFGTRLRGELKFDSFEALREQIRKDVEAARLLAQSAKKVSLI